MKCLHRNSTIIQYAKTCLGFSCPFDGVDHYPQGRIVKRNDPWACEWECSSYYPYTQHRGLDSTNILEIFGIGRKKRGAYSWYQSDCDCNISW